MSLSATSTLSQSSPVHIPEVSPNPSLVDVLDALKAAGEETRLRILLLLNERELTVTDLTRVLGQSQPRVSRHIRILLEAGLIERHREGGWIILRTGGIASKTGVIRSALESLAKDLPERRHDRAQLDLINQERHEQAQAFFAREAANWNTVRNLHVDETRVEAAILELAGPNKISQLIDLGTGTGRILELLADRTVHALGFDVNADMLSYARVQLDRAGLRHCQVRQGDIFQLPQLRHTSDLVVLHQVLHFLSDPASAVREAANMLVPGGRILIVDFAPHDLEQLRTQQNHERLGLSRAQMNRWRRDAGLRMIRQLDLPPDTNDANQNLTVSLWLMERPNVTRIRKNPET